MSEPAVDSNPAQHYLSSFPSDGKLEEFRAGRAGKDIEGDYHGYLSDAAELAKRLESRGYSIVRVPRKT